MSVTDRGSTDFDPGRTSAFAMLAVLVSGCALFNALCLAIADSVKGPEPELFFMLGGVVVQPVLFGFWAALGPGSLLIRLPYVIATEAFVLLFARVRTCPGISVTTYAARDRGTTV
jgi:hypothetical protein